MNRKKWMRYIVVALLMVFIINLVKVDIWDANEKLLAKEILSADIVGEKVNLAQLTPFEWDKVYSFGPYESKESVYKTIGYKWDRISETVSEGMNQLVFLKDDKVVCYIYGYPQNNKYGISFDSTNSNDEVAVLYAKDNPVFDVAKMEDIVYLEHRRSN